MHILPVARALSGALLLTLLALNPGAALAMSDLSVSSGNIVGVTVDGAGNGQTYPGGTVFSFTEGSLSGSLLPLTFTDFFIPTVSFTSQRYEFTTVDPFTAILNLVTGVIDPVLVSTDVEVRRNSDNALIDSGTFQWTLTTGSITNRFCGSSAGTNLTGSALSPSGNITLVGSGCMPFSNTLFGLRIPGTMSVVATPEPGTSLLLASGLVGLAALGRRRRA